MKTRIFWTFDLCKNEALKYKLKKDFRQNSPNAYAAAIKHKWLNKFNWLNNKSINLNQSKIYYVYKYEFINYKTIYIGLTLRIKERAQQHLQSTSPIYKFSKIYNISIPSIDILKSNLTQKEAQYYEDYYIRYYKNLGYTLLNKGKTGVGISSVGGMHCKWTKPKCFNEAKKYQTRGEFFTKCPSAYKVVLKNNWFKDMPWFIKKRHSVLETLFTNTKLNKEWNYEKNKAANEYKVSEKVWWKCSKCNYEWLTSTNKRLNNRGCPRCAQKSRVKKFSKPIDMLDVKTNKILKTFNSISEAESYINSKNIYKVLNGTRKKAGGFLWQYHKEA